MTRRTGRSTIAYVTHVICTAPVIMPCCCAWSYGLFCQCRYLPDNLPYWASPGNWLSPEGHADLNNLVNDPSLYKLCIFPLKLFNVGAVTASDVGQLDHAKLWIRQLQSLINLTIFSSPWATVCSGNLTVKEMTWMQMKFIFLHCIYLVMHVGGV